MQGQAPASTLLRARDFLHPHISHWEKYSQMEMMMAHQHHLCQNAIVMFEEGSTLCGR